MEFLTGTQSRVKTRLTFGKVNAYFMLFYQTNRISLINIHAKVQWVQKKLAHQKSKEDATDNMYTSIHMQVHLELIENINTHFKKIVMQSTYGSK